MSLKTDVHESCDLINTVSRMKSQINQGKKQEKEYNSFFDTYSSTIMPALTSFIAIRQYTACQLPSDISQRAVSLLRKTVKVFETEMVDDFISLKREADKLYQDLSTCWTPYMVPMTQVWLQPLNNLALVTSNKSAVLALIDRIRKVSQFPVSKEVLEHYNMDVVTAQNLLSSVHFTDDVRNFLTKMQNNQATILDLSDSILQWIRENHCENNIRLSLVQQYQ